jgi:hypothetical protein
MGKSILLRVLGQRLEEWAYPVFLPYGAMSPGELSSWILGILGETVEDAADPVSTLCRYAMWFRGSGRFLAVLIDDADSLPPETARMVGGWIGETDGGLCPVLAACDGARTEQVLAALGPDPYEASLSEPMNARETRLYVEHKLDRAGVSEEIRERFDPATIDRIFDRSRGVPRLVDEFALHAINPDLGAFATEWSAETGAGQGEDSLSLEASSRR